MTIEARIQAELDRIEADESVQIIFAVESGSRAWGFPSTNSDYDVRFVYARPVWWYITVFEGRDVIECPISDELDVSGWDLRKALALLRKSNPTLMEWIDSPMVYRQHDTLATTFRNIAHRAFLPLASAHHYRSMARQHQSRGTGKDQVRLKHYLYSLRPCLAARWVIDTATQPPMQFSTLVDTYLPSGELRAIVDELLRLKSQSVETDVVDRLPALDDYIEASMLELESRMPESTPALTTLECNDIFHSMLKACWNT